MFDLVICFLSFIRDVSWRYMVPNKTCFNSNLVTPWPFYFDYSLLSSFSSPSQLVGFQTIIESNYVLSSGDKICASCRSINMLQCKTWIRLVEP